MPAEVLEVYRYLCVRVALDYGTLHQVSTEDWPPGQLVCMDWRTGKLYGVNRPSGWSCAEEERHVSELRALLLEARTTCE